MKPDSLAVHFRPHSSWDSVGSQRRIALRAGVFLAVFGAASSAAEARQAVFPGSTGPCTPQFQSGSGGGPGLVDFSTYWFLRTVVEYDDPALGAGIVVGGRFVSMGGAAAQNVAHFDGDTWRPMGDGLPSFVCDLAVYDDGSGPKLFAGLFGTVAGSFFYWDGANWTPPPGGHVLGTIYALESFDDGTGPGLYLAGSLFQAGGAPASRIARWDADGMSPLGAGIDGEVLALCVHDDGTGSALYAGGNFTTAGGAKARDIAKWDGTEWTPLGVGTVGNVRALASVDFGAGPELFVGGQFPIGGDVFVSNLARVKDGLWFDVGGGVDAPIDCFLTSGDPSNPALYLGGTFLNAGGAPAARVARWDGNTFSSLGEGVTSAFDTRVYALGHWQFGNTDSIVAAGSFEKAGGKEVNSVARWADSTWNPLGNGLNGGVSAGVLFDSGSGAELHVGGSFERAGDVELGGIGRFDGNHWHSLDGGVSGTVSTLVVREEAGGSALYVGGKFDAAGGVPALNVARWDGQAWSALGTGVPGVVRCLAFFDDGTGPALYVGRQAEVGGGAVGKWDGSTWTQVPGSFASFGSQGSVSSMVVWDDGQGPNLCVAGDFGNIDDVVALGIARWDGSAWHAMGSNWHRVQRLHVVDVGADRRLYAGGVYNVWFSSYLPLYRRTPNGWAGLGALGMTGAAYSMAMLPTLSGDRLHAGGLFVSGDPPFIKYQQIMRVLGDQLVPVDFDIEDLYVSTMVPQKSGDWVGAWIGGYFSYSPMGHSFLTSFGVSSACFDLSSEPGCGGKTALLASSSAQLQLGEPTTFSLSTPGMHVGTGFYFLGQLGLDANGCGHELDGIGELLLTMNPEPLMMGAAGAPQGVSELVVELPTVPTWVGLSFAIQGLFFAPDAPTSTLLFSNALTGKVRG